MSGFCNTCLFETYVYSYVWNSWLHRSLRKLSCWYFCFPQHLYEWFEKSQIKIWYGLVSHLSDLQQSISPVKCSPRLYQPIIHSVTENHFLNFTPDGTMPESALEMQFRQALGCPSNIHLGITQIGKKQWTKHSGTVLHTPVCGNCKRQGCLYWSWSSCIILHVVLTEDIWHPDFKQALAFFVHSLNLLINLDY